MRYIGYRGTADKVKLREAKNQTKYIKTTIAVNSCSFYTNYSLVVPNILDQCDSLDDISTMLYV